MNQDIVSIVSLVVGVTSFVASIIFFVSGLKTEKRNRSILTNINTAINGWQNQIMSTTLEAIESRPEIIGARSHQLEAKTKQEFISNLSSSIQKIVENPLEGEAAKAQHQNLESLLSCYTELSKPADPFAALRSPSQNINQPGDGNASP